MPQLRFMLKVVKRTSAFVCDMVSCYVEAVPVLLCLFVLESHLAFGGYETATRILTKAVAF